MRRINIIKLCLLLLLIACEPDRTLTSPEFKTLTSAVYASGKIMPLHDYQVFATTSGILQQQLVEAGDLVSQEQPIFVISQEASSLQLQQARENLMISRRDADANSTQIQNLLLQLAQAREKYLQDSVDFARQRALMKKNATSKVQLEQAALRFKTSKSAFESAKLLERENRQEMEDRVKDSQIQYQLAVEDQGNTVLKSRIEGKVYQVFLKEGEMVNLNQPLASIGDPHAFYLQLIVDERDIAKIQPGMKVLFSTEILADSILEAQVSKIYPYMNDENRSFRVDAIIPQSHQPMYEGASVEANIIVAQKDRALVIPRSLIVGEDSVWVDEDGESVKVKINTGLQNLEMVEVLSGIDENTKLILP